MLSFEELNSFKNQNDFIELLKNKLPKKRFDKIIEKATYNNRISQLQSDLVNLQNWVKKNNKRVCVIFEGRDAAGKGGAIKRFIEHLNPRYSRVVALSEPTQQEKGQWYFQRYLKKMPSSGEIIFFDRSWYNRAIVEPVMEFCDSQQYDLFMNQVNEFEKMLTEDGIILIKLWFSITKKEQKIRFIKRLSNPLKTWKFSKVDMEGQKRWKIYTDYKEKMFLKTDSTDSPWKIIDSNNKFSARISAIEYVLSKFKALPNNQKKLKNKKILKKEKLKDISKKDLKLLNKNKSLISLISRNDTSLPKTLRYYKYEKQLKKLQIEMIKLQNWVYKKNKKVIIICEGRDAAGKGGAIRRYFSVSKQTQAKRFSDIQNSLLKKWKFTEVDGKAQELWDEYSHFKDKMFEKTNTKNSPWNIISADRKIQARIEAINLILKNVPYDSNTLIHSEKINF